MNFTSSVITDDISGGALETAYRETVARELTEFGMDNLS